MVALLGNKLDIPGFSFGAISAGNHVLAVGRKYFVDTLAEGFEIGLYSAHVGVRSRGKLHLRAGFQGHGFAVVTHADKLSVGPAEAFGKRAGKLLQKPVDAMLAAIHNGIVSGVDNEMLHLDAQTSGISRGFYPAFDVGDNGIDVRLAHGLPDLLVALGDVGFLSASHACGAPSVTVR